MAEVRWIGPDDWEMWRDIRLRSLADSPDAYGSLLSRELEFTEADWRQRLNDRAVLAFESGEPVAMGAAWRRHDGDFQIVAMWVEPGHRGRGLSTLVLHELVARGRSEGARIGLCVTQGNEVARSAYERFGFAASDEPSSPLREGSELLVDHMVLPE